MERGETPASSSGGWTTTVLPSIVRAIGGAAAAMLALSWSRVHVPPAIDRWLLAHPVKASPDLVWGEPPRSELEPAVTQPRAFLYVLVAVVVATAGWFLIDALLARYRASPWVARVLSCGLVGASLVQAFAASPFLGDVALVALVPLAMVFLASESPGADDDATPAQAPVFTGGVAVLVAEALSLGWGVWLTCFQVLGVFTALLLVGLAAAAGFRAARDLDGANGGRALERDAVACAPMLLLPFLGLVREPSPWCVVAAAVASAALAVALPRIATLPLERALRALTIVFAPAALIAFVLVPMRFRELGSIDNFDHESQHLGWINSVSFGKLMMADAGYIYGPLREYLLSLFCAIRGFTLEHVREAHTWTNFLGVALMLYAGWRVSRGRPWLHLWWTYVLVAQTALLFLVKYRDQVSFGWVDLARSGFACVALVCGIEAAASDDRDPSWKDFFRVHRTLIGWGAFCGLATLYSQDYGPCAAGAVGLAIVGDSLLRQRAGSLRARLERMLRLGLAWSTGVLGVLGAFLAIYGCFGKAGLMIHRVTTWTGFLLAAAWSGKRFPIGEAGWLDWKSLSARDSFGFLAIDYAMPALFIVIGATIVAMAAVRRAWTRRTSLIFALVLFAFTTLRHALMHPDMAHIRSDGTGAVLLFFAIVCDVATLRAPVLVGSRTLPVAVGSALALLVAVGWSGLEESWTPIREKLHLLATGEESPSHGPPYDNHALRRAGDVNVPADAKALAAYVEQTTRPGDAVWATTGFMTGGNLQFLVGRRNPTPFDVAHELTTRSDQAEVLHALEVDPPIVIIGDYLPLIGEEARRYVDAHWKRENVPGYSGVVRRYQSPLPVASAAP